MAPFQTLGIVALLTVMFNNRAKYGIMASAPSFRISPGTPSGHIDFFLPIAASYFLILFLLMVKVSPE